MNVKKAVTSVQHRDLGGGSVVPLFRDTLQVSMAIYAPSIATKKGQGPSGKRRGRI